MRASACLVPCLFALLGLGACDSMPTIGGGGSKVDNPNLVANVRTLDQNGNEIEIRVTAPKGNVNMELAVKSLQSEKYAEAANYARLAIADNQPYEQSSTSARVVAAQEHFALAVSEEALGSYAAAIEHYDMSNVYNSSMDAQTGSKRSRALQSAAN